LSSLQTEFNTTTDAYNTLKGRAKAVASELKDRRIEVRTLSSQNEELASSNASFETQVSNLRALINQHELTIVYKDKDMDTLNEKIKAMDAEIAKGRDRSLQDRSVGEKAIASYKRKAQEALAAANARLAAANQAREEAESDAKNARSASDDAVERVRVAEAKRLDAELMASKANTQLNTDRAASAKDVHELKELIATLNEAVMSLRAELEDATEKRVQLVAELEKLHADYFDQKEKNADLREQLIQTHMLRESLQREVSDLNEEVQRSSAVAFKRAKENGEASVADNHIDSKSFSNLSVNGVSIDRHESDGTIIMLQQELQGANEAIAELKLALRTAILERADNDYSREKPVSFRGAEAVHGGVGGGSAGEFNTGNDSTPLFFAIEKQNELKTARDEINRLANMLGDAESSKQEAYDAMDDMRQKMEEANSRLLRYERLGMKSARPQTSHQSSYGPFRSNASGGHSSVLGDDSRILQAGSDSAVNLEYLKNVMLSFLTATTLADRRKLVPVVATVLCLTPEEQAQAISSVERTAGFTGVASSFWENIESKAHNLTGI
jgi:chromosome segregation ATPase